MTDIAITATPDEQSVHLHTIRDNTPDWYSESLDAAKIQLALNPLKIPDWFRNASDAARQSLKDIHARSRRSLNALDQLLIGLKSAADFAEPLLVEAIQQKFGHQLNVRQIFYARKMGELECESTPYEVSRSKLSGLEGYFYQAVSVLEAALRNFTEDETTTPVCENCHLLTRYRFDRRPAGHRPYGADVRVARLPIEAHEFAQMCRDLDLGAQYYDYLRDTLNDQILLTASKPSSGKLYGTLVIAHRHQLALAAQIAVLKQDIQNERHVLVREILINQNGRQWGGEDIKYSRFWLCGCALENLLIIGPVLIQEPIMMFHFSTKPWTFPRPCLAYIPGDPEFVLKEYLNLDEFADDLTTRLCNAEYRAFFSQFVPLSQQQAFFTKLKALLDPKGVYALFDNFDPASKSRIKKTDHYGYGRSLSDVWLGSAEGQLRLIMENSKAVAVATSDIDDREFYASLSWWGNKLLDVLNFAAFVVPGLGEVMVAVSAVQMLYELADGLEAWSEGQLQEAWGHFSVVLLGVAGLAVPKALLVVKESAFVKRLVRVAFADGRVRLHDSDIGGFKHQVALPPDVTPDARGLYVHDGDSYLPVDGGHYKISTTGEETRLVHPDGASQYSPRIRANGDGAWVHEFEQPLTWDRRTLLRRIGHTVDALSDSQLEQLRAVSGVTDDELRRIYIDHQLPPPLFREGLRLFQTDRTFQALLDDLSSRGPGGVERIDGDMQLRLIKRDGVWPSDKRLEVIDDWSSIELPDSDEIVEDNVIYLTKAKVLSGRVIPNLLEGMDREQARQLLGEEVPRETYTRDFPCGILAVGVPCTGRRRLQARADSKHSAVYARRLQQLATQHRHELIEEDMAAGNLSSDSNVLLVQRTFPGLPTLVIEEILEHASGKELAEMAKHSRLPLRLAEQARSYLPRVRLMQAHAVIHFDHPLTLDAVRLALHKLEAIAGRLNATSIELRAGDSAGALLDRVGEANAAQQVRLVGADMEHWEVFDASGKSLYSHSGKEAFYKALCQATSGEPSSVEALNVAAQDLRSALARQPLSDSAARRALGVQPIKPGYKSPWRLADGRFGYPLSPVDGAAGRPFACRAASAKAYPSKTLEQVEAFLGFAGRSDTELLAKLTALGKEYDQLQTTLATWVEEGGGGYARARRRVSASIKSAWQRVSPLAYAADGTCIGHTLDLSDESIESLPAIKANMDHVGSLKLSGMALSDDSMAFLEPFGALRWLNLSKNNLTRLPEFTNGGAGLTQLNLSANDIRLTAQSSARLEAMHPLKILRLCNNLRLGWTANLSEMRSLNKLYLRHTGTTTFPVGAERLTQLALIDLHSNQITTLPEYAFEHFDRINVHENPLSAAVLERLGGIVEPLLAHVTLEEGRESWLSDLEPAERARCETLWDALTAEPLSSAFFTVIADTTRSAEYLSATTRAQLRARIWDMLTAVSEKETFRIKVFGISDARVTCGDGSVLEFMNLERELFVLKLTEAADGPKLESDLLYASKRLFRLKLVDDCAQRDVSSRGPGFKEQSEVILAYRTGLADKLDLPVKSREMLYPRTAEVSQAALDDAYTQVLKAEAVSRDRETFLVEQEFWERHLCVRYASEFNTLTAHEIGLIAEKSDALYDLSRLPEEPGSQADQATRDAWRSGRDAAVARVMRELNMREDEILVDGVMQDAFYVKQSGVLATLRRKEEIRGLRLLTQKVLDSYPAKQETGS